MAGQDLSAISVEQAFSRYPDEWVLMEITRRHNDYRKTYGRVIAHSTDRDDLDAYFSRFLHDNPEAQTFEFYTGALVPEGAVVVL